MSAIKIKENLYWVGVLDPNLRVFDVIMRTDYGTSYNSYLLKTENYTVLFETSKAKFFDSYIENIREVCDIAEIDYIVVDHTEPDHVGSLEKLLSYAPKAKVVGSSVAIGFLKEICNMDIPSISVSDNDEIKIDHLTLKFLSVPFLHWPDSIYTYIDGLDIIVTCDSFGCHYASEKITNDKIDGDFVDAYKYYFDMIMGPFKTHIQYALNRIKDLKVEIICPGHGPVLVENLDFYLDLYNKWSFEEKKELPSKPVVVNAFVSAYGYSEELAHAVNRGIKDVVDTEIHLYDMVTSDKDTVSAKILEAHGILFGTPTVNGDALFPVANLVTELNGITHGGKVAGAYGSYGWSGEGPDLLMGRLSLMRMNCIEPALKINFKPSSDNLEEAINYGRRFGKKLKEEWIKMEKNSDGKTYWKCTVCGEIFEGALPPLTCPVCGVGEEAFVEFTPDTVNFKEDTNKKFVIVGSGATAVSAAEAIRKRDKTAKINIISREKEYPYYRPVLTKQLSEKVLESEYFIKQNSFYEDNNIELNLGLNVETINRDTKIVLTNSGEKFSYDKLLIATGASCFIPPFKGAELDGVLTLREKDDFDKLLLKLDTPKKISIIGGGLLGLETACSLVALGHIVTVIEVGDRILPRQLDREGGDMLEKIIESSSVIIENGIFVSEISGRESVEGVRLENGDFIESDFVIISTGVKCNVSLAENLELKIDRAISVDENMLTSHQDIYSAGDCASYKGQYYGIWETAIEQGAVAGANMSGDKKAYTPKIYGATLNAFETSLFSIGDIGSKNDTEYVEISEKNDIKNSYKKIFFLDGKVVGGILIGDIKKINSLVTAVNSNMSYEDAEEIKLV